MDEQQRNLFIAIALSIAILLGFQFFFAKPSVPKLDVQQTAQTQPQGAAAPGQATPTAPDVAGTAIPASIAPREEVLGSSPRVAIRTPRLSGSINLAGARIDDLTLVNYHETIDPQSPEIVLLAPGGTEHPYFVQFGWYSSDPGVKVPGPDTLWTSTGGDLTPEHPVELRWDNNDGLSFVLRYAVDNDYMFTATETVENHTPKKVALTAYARDARLGEVPVAGTYLLHEGPIGVLNGVLHDGGTCFLGIIACDKYNYADVKKGTVTDTTTGGWLGFADKYWLTSLVPNQGEQIKTRFVHETLDHMDLYQADYTGSEQIAEPGASISDTSRVFTGAKELATLDRYETEGVPRFDRAVDFGWFYFLTKPIFLTLDFFYHWIGNFGLSIMLLTVLIKALFFPLANKSYRAMSKMKQLQPEMAKLRERFGEDKQRLNQEMMALYKRVGANPMAGCLPIFIQIPVFFSLYKTLYVTIEMRHAPFYGWIHDLSAPDPTTFINLFGLLPFQAPAMSFLHIGAWPLIMGCTMFLQQKLNPQPPDPMQAKMFMILPVVFTFMLSQFAAGLVIYWSWNNLLSVAQQWVIMRRAGAAKKK